MSSTKGNLARTRPQKHQNRSAFKNDLYDLSVKTKFINSIQPSGICSRCKDIIEWKIKYKKYKPLTAPKKCVRCDQKVVKHAYHVMCIPCSKSERVCAKCCKGEEIIEVKSSTSAEDEEMKQIIKALPERKRRTLLRYLKKQEEGVKKERKGCSKDVDNGHEDDVEALKLNLAEKINKLKLDAQQNNIEDYDSDFDDFDSDCDDSENDISDQDVSDK